MDLGVYVDENLTFEEHINLTAKKANKLLGMITHYITHKAPTVMVPLYKSLIRTILEYGNPVWHPRLRKHTDLIENIQRRFTKRIIGMGNRNYEERLRSLKLPSLEYRRARGDMIETFKIIKQYYDHHSTKGFFKLQDKSITRGHPFKIAKQTCKSSAYAHFFTNRIVNQWNSLPNTVVEAESINSFKNRLDKHWARYQYSTNIIIE